MKCVWPFCSVPTHTHTHTLTLTHTLTHTNTHTHTRRHTQTHTIPHSHAEIHMQCFENAYIQLCVSTGSVLYLRKVMRGVTCESQKALAFKCNHTHRHTNIPTQRNGLVTI